MSEVPLYLNAQAMRAVHAVWGKQAAASRGGARLRYFFFFFTLVTGPRRSLSLKLSDTRVYEPQIRACGTCPFAGRRAPTCSARLCVAAVSRVRVGARAPCSSS